MSAPDGDDSPRRPVRIMVFLHGTVIMHRGGVGKTPVERGQQVRDREASVHRYEDYVPIGDACEKLHRWQREGAEIVYLSSHRNAEDVEKDRLVLARHGFPGGPVLYRRGAQTYADLAERALPAVLIEDDCESIGGEAQMTYPHVRPDLQRAIRSIVVPEFAGIDDLPAALEELCAP